MGFHVHLLHSEVRRNQAHFYKYKVGAVKPSSSDCAQHTDMHAIIGEASFQVLFFFLLKRHQKTKLADERVVHSLKGRLTEAFCNVHNVNNLTGSTNRPLSPN